MKTVLISAISIVFILMAFTPKTNSALFKKNNVLNATIGGIEFKEEKWQNLLALARKENKFIFLDIYATWCGPCKKLKSNTFSDVEVGEYFNKKFINVALNGEVGEGLELAKHYKIKGYPTLLFINGNGEIVKHTGGYHNPKQFLELGKSIVN